MTAEQRDDNPEEVPLCGNGHPLTETARERVTKSVEDVVYTKQRIKHFNREGSEYWTEIEVPDLVTRDVPFDRITYVCRTCDETRVVDREAAAGEGAA